MLDPARAYLTRKPIRKSALQSSHALQFEQVAETMDDVGLRSLSGINLMMIGRKDGRRLSACPLDWLEVGQQLCDTEVAQG